MVREKQPEQKVTRVQGGEVEGTRAEKVRDLHEQVLERPVARRPAGGEEAARPDQYRSEGGIPRFLGAVQRRMEGSWIYQVFKLPGTNYVVKDQRYPEGGEGKAIRKESEFAIQDDKTAEVKEKGYVNYLGERQFLKFQEQKAAGEVSRLLSEFEKLLVERFEKGRVIEKESEDSRPHFREKTDEEWRSFFSKFLNRSQWKEAELKELREFIFRGLISLKKGDGKHAMLIGDILLSDGRAEKFSRLKILKDLMNLLAGLKPGASLQAEMLIKGAGRGGVKYLALAHKHEEGVIKTGKEVAKGMFGPLKTEEEVARRLGIKGGGYKGPIKWGEGGEEETPAFVPAGFSGRQKLSGRPRTLIAVVFAAIVLLAIIGIWIALRFVL